MPVAVHTINFRGLSGAIFSVLAIATILYVIGFATNSWSVNQNRKDGLWESCTCHKYNNKGEWLTAVQVMMAIALIGMLVAFLLICLYMCVHSISKNSTILATVIVCFVTVLFMLIGFCIYGSKEPDYLSWSFAISVVSAILCLVAGILAIVQMRQSGVSM